MKATFENKFGSLRNNDWKWATIVFHHTCVLESPGNLSSSSAIVSQNVLRYPVSTAARDTSRQKMYTAGCGGRSMYSEGAMNSMVDDCEI